MTPRTVHRRDSLRVRLPIVISIVVVVVLGTFLWTTNRALEQTLLRAAGDRSQRAAEQIAALMSQGTARGVLDARRAAASDALRQYLTDRKNPGGVRAALQPLLVAGQPPIEIWDASGACALQIAAPSSEHVALPPPGPAPAAAGLSPFRVSGKHVAYEMVADIHDRPPATPSAGGEGEAPPRRIGALIVRRVLMPAQTAMINRLVGNNGLIEVGNLRGDVWTDFEKPLPVPPVDLSRDRVAVYRTREGEPMIGASRIVAGTPWVAWIEFSQTVVLEPARVLFRRMLALGLFFVVFAAGLVAIATGRITTPLHELTTASEAIAAGELTRRVSAERRDEIGRLGASFNTMVERVATAQQELEGRVQERTAGLRDAVDELEAFTYSVSHDLRAPLRHVVGFATLLEQSSASALGDEGRRHLQTIIGAANRMGRLIDDLLAFSRVGRTALASRPVALDQLMVEARQEVTGGGVGANVSWTVHDLPAVYGDPALLRLALINLLSNAVKYSSRVPHPAVEIGVQTVSAGEVVVFVRDNGEGFDMQYAHKLFGVFQRLHGHDEFEGTGIGLANVRRIVQRHGGRTWAEGVVNGGATFYFSLPIQGGTGDGPSHG